MILLPIPDKGTFLTIPHFKAMLDFGIFYAYDGHGKYATESGMTGIDVDTKNILDDYTHIVWFHN
jgi:hypothetical protein